MATKLDSLLASIHPARTFQETAQRSDEALNHSTLGRPESFGNTRPVSEGARP